MISLEIGGQESGAPLSAFTNRLDAPLRNALHQGPVTRNSTYPGLQESTLENPHSKNLQSVCWAQQNSALLCGVESWTCGFLDSWSFVKQAPGSPFTKLIYMLFKHNGIQASLVFLFVFKRNA